MENPSIIRALRAYRDAGLVPMHMPGHKRNADGLCAELPWGLDVTEVGPFDALHAPEGLLLGAMEGAAARYGSKHSFFLVNGSSGGLLAAIRALVGDGTAVVAQNSHRSVFHALELCGTMPHYVTPRMDADFGVSGGIEAQDVEAALKNAPDARLVVVTSPTYEGVISDISAIANVAHAHGAALLVDEAHGAHLPFSDAFPQSAMRCGADVVVQSLHKTLPSLTQTAILHIMSDRADARAIQRQLSIFETSSPSFVLLASIDECVRLMAREGAARLDALSARLHSFSESARALRRLRVRGMGECTTDVPGAAALDPSKLLISCAGTDISGRELAARLANEHGIVLEMHMGHTALAMSTLCDPPGALERLSTALFAIDETLHGAPIAAPLPQLPAMVQHMPIGSAQSGGEFVQLGDAPGRICCEYVWAYPPGVPLLVPGAMVNAEAVAHIKALLRGGVTLHSTHDQLPKALRVC